MGRANRMNGYVGEFKSSFLSCEKDMEAIVKKLFVVVVIIFHILMKKHTIYLKYH